MSNNSDTMDVFGFWIYILSDCVLFATIFAVYAALNANMYGGVGLKGLFDLSYVLTETSALLISSFTCGLAIMAMYKNNLKQVMLWLMATFLLGFAFIGMEINEFINLTAEGHSWQTNASLSSFFTLVGTHGLHVLIGLLWMAVIILQLLIFELTPVLRRRLTYFALFWAFLDIIWIFVYIIVYLMGAI